MFSIRNLLLFLIFVIPLPVFALEFSIPCQGDIDLGQCIVSIYNYAFAIVGIVALVIFIYGGFEYFLAAGSITKAEKGKERIQAAVLGIILLFSSYIILYTINPDLVKGSFKLIGIGGKEPEGADYDNTLLDPEGDLIRNDQILKEEESPFITKLTGGKDDGDSGSNSNSTASTFDKAAKVDFIKSISISPANKTSASEYSVDANRLLNLSIELDTDKFLPLERRFSPTQGQGTYLTLDARAVASSPIEWVNLRANGFNGYPGEWTKFSATFNGAKEAGVYKNYGSVEELIRDNIKKGSDFIIETNGLQGSSLSKASAKFFASVKAKGNIFIPQTELNKKLELTISVLAQDEQKKLIKDEKKIILNVAKANRPPIATSSRSCAITVKEGKTECFEGLVENMSSGSYIDCLLYTSPSPRD